MIRTQIYLPPELYQEISLLAKRERKSKAQVIRDAVTKSIKKERKETVGEALLKLAELGRKLKVRGPKDLSTNHDKYLYEEL